MVEREAFVEMTRNDRYVLY